MNEQIASLKQELKESDGDIIRIIDDLVDILVSKRLLRMADFPEPTRVQLQRRRDLREQLQELLPHDPSDELELDYDRYTDKNGSEP
jgi:hypothetical protein